MLRRRLQRAVAIVLGSPRDGVAVVIRPDLPGGRVSRPHERSAVGGLVLPGYLDGVVRDRRPEVGAPGGLTMIAVRAGISEDIHTRTPDLKRQSIGMGMRGNAEVAMRTAVAPAPDLIVAGRARIG